MSLHIRSENLPLDPYTTFIYFFTLLFSLLIIPQTAYSSTTPATTTPIQQIATSTPVVIIPETIEEKIARRAIEEGYDPLKAQSIAWAESRFKPNAKNPGSTASGVYQFLNGTFQNYCVTKYGLATSTAQKNDPDVQIDCAVKMLAAGGESHWNESRPYWRFYPGQQK